MVAGLSATEESLVYARLRPDADAPPLDNTTVFREIDDVEMHQAIEVVGTQVLFPVERADAAEIMRARSSGSASFINIPEDEISTRARIEMSPSQLVIIDCSKHSRISCHFIAEKLNKDQFEEVLLYFPNTRPRERP
jgi:hypothetical protein